MSSVSAMGTLYDRRCTLDLAWLPTGLRSSSSFGDGSSRTQSDSYLDDGTSLSVSLAPGTSIQMRRGRFQQQEHRMPEKSRTVFFDDVRVTAFYDTTCECEDGDVCNGFETCSGDVCEPGTSLDCDDAGRVHRGSVRRHRGLSEASTAVWAERPATGSAACASRSPARATRSATTGSTATAWRAASANLCAPGTPVVCDDGVGCTFDACDEALDACESLPDHAVCQNGVFCDGVELCDPVLDCQAGVAESCDDGVGCTVDSCNTGADACDNVPDDGSCQNGLFCDGAEICDAALDCQPGPAVDCDDGVGCTADSCNEGTDSCDNTPDDGPCQNGLFCDGAESCDAALDCQPGADACAGLSCDENIDFCVAPGPAAAILNEYNGVAPGNFLKNDNSDVFWGRIEGNGGDWFELVVTTDHLDMRGWDLVWSNDERSSVQILTLTSDPIWSDLRAGTIITVSEGLADDVSYDPMGGDWWINVQAADGASGAYITASDFEVSNNDWQLFLLDASDLVVFGPAGEGINPTGGIGSDEVFKLEEAPSADITPQSLYNDGTSSTFGAPNIWSAGSDRSGFLSPASALPGGHPERVQRRVARQLPRWRQFGQLLGHRRGERRRLVRAGGDEGPAGSPRLGAGHQSSPAARLRRSP